MTLQYTALTPQEITEEFSNFWKPFWQRDQADEQFDDSNWHDFPQITVDIGDLDRWMKIIRNLPGGKATGPCGWSNDELKVLPRACIADLVTIFQKVSETSFGMEMMKAKTILLPKVAVPTSMNHVRPITILSCLYRLFSRMIFQTVAHVWKLHFPIQISGGLPGRGVKEIAYSQKRHIEDAITDDFSIGGLTLDLIKAFNTLGRFPTACLMIRLGIPRIRSLSQMVRYPTLNQHVGNGIIGTVPLACRKDVPSAFWR